MDKMNKKRDWLHLTIYRKIFSAGHAQLIYNGDQHDHSMTWYLQNTTITIIWYDLKWNIKQQKNWAWRIIPTRLIFKHFDECVT